MASAKGAAVDGIKLVLFIFGVDAGIDNLGMLAQVKHELKDCKSVVFQDAFCLFHQLHLIVKGMLDVLDDWCWPAPHNPPSKYFPAVATVANVWRSTGNGAKILMAAKASFNDEVADMYFTKLPGKPLRGRWVSFLGKSRAIPRRCKPFTWSWRQPGGTRMILRRGDT